MLAGECWNPSDKSDHERGGSTVYFTPVSYPMNTHDTDGIGNLVDDAILADSNPPVILRTCKLPTSGRAGID